ncbi:MAG: YraN family protein [Acidobacteriota bacterium]|nr:YraN family protein [Acidobacteriota bacterium]
MRRRRYAGNTGRIGEDLAYRYLRGRGCIVTARNYRTREGGGEIDLVVRDEGRLVFVEVKTRTSQEWGAPEEAVDAEKRRRLLRGAGDYTLRVKARLEEARFDIVSVVLGEKVQIEWHRGAFGMVEAAGRRG